VPKLELLLRLCYWFGTSPLRFLTEDDMVVDPAKVNFPTSNESSHRPGPSPRPFDADGVQRALEAVLASDEHPPPAMREIARRLGHAHSSLHKRFPELCRAISARYLAYEKARGGQKRQKLCDEVRQATLRIHAQGVYPNSTQVASLLSAPGFIRDPEANATWHETLRELGWEY
jgi:hypothetical protein